MDNSQDSLCYNCDKNPISQEGEKFMLCVDCYKELCEMIEEEKKKELTE